MFHLLVTILLEYSLKGTFLPTELCWIIRRRPDTDPNCGTSLDGSRDGTGKGITVSSGKELDRVEFVSGICRP